MELDADVFLADFGDSLLEFELRLTELEYEDGEAVVSWELEKINDQLGGISYVVLVLSPQQTVEYHEPDPRTGDSQTMRVEAEPGDEIDVILYDTLNTDYEPGDGATGPGDAQVNGVIPDDAGGPLDRGVLTVNGDRYEVRLDDLEVGESGVVVSIGHQKEHHTAADITVSYAVSVGGSTVATGSFVPPDAFAQDRETIPAVPGDLVTVVLESGGDSVTLSGRVEGDNGDDGAVGPEPGPIEIVSCDASDQVGVGESAVVTATVENIGAAEGGATVVIEAGGAESPTDVTLAPGERTTVAVGFEFDDAGEFPASVELR